MSIIWVEDFTCKENCEIVGEQKLHLGRKSEEDMQIQKF